MLINGLLAMVLTACQVPTAGSGLTLTPVVTLGQDAAGAARVRIRVPEGEGDRHVQSMPASWNEAVVYFDSPTARVYPYAFTIPRTAFTQVGSGIVSSLPISLSMPGEVTWDRNGDLLVIDADATKLLRYNLTTGVTTTVAGTGVSGYSGDGGAATAAQLGLPVEVVVDSAGNIYISDSANRRVRRIDAATGVISTYVGTGASGSSGDGGLATAATLTTPECLAIDAAGNLYISDYSAQRVRKVNAVTGVITTVAGTGTAGYSGDGGAATAAQLNAPEGMWVDVAGNLFIADMYNHRVRKVNAATGVITTVVGTGTAGYSGDSGAATSAKLNNPVNLCMDPAGHLYISDMLNHCVRKVDAVTGVITTIAGTGSPGFSGDGGPATSAKFNATCGLTLDASGTLYIGDIGNAKIRQVSGGYSEFVASTGSSPAMPVLRPATDYAISVDLRTSGSPATLQALGFLGGQTLQAGPNTFTLNLLDNLNVRTVAGDPTVRDGTGAAAFFENPSGVAVDAAGTYAYIADGDNHCIRRVELATGIVTTVAGNGQYSSTNGSATNARFGIPMSLALVGTNLYVCDFGNCSVRKIDLALAPTNSGFVTTIAGNNGWGFADGNDSTAMFAGPQGIVAKPDGTALYIGDSSNYRIRKIDLTLAQSNAGFVTTVAGSGSPGSTNGTGTAAKFDSPRGVALDGAGNLYVADYWNQRVRKINLSTQAVTTHATLASYPFGIAFDGTDLWVSEWLSGARIRKVTLAGAVSVVAGSATGGFVDATGTAARFSNPSGLAFQPGGELIVADRDNHAIRRLVRATGVVSTIAGSPAAGWVDGSLAAAKFRSISGVSVDRVHNAVYLADTGNHRIRKVDLESGMVSTVAGSGFAAFTDATGTAAQFNVPYDVAINDAGTTLYVSDTENFRIRQIDLASGAVTTLAGNGNYGHVDGTGTAAGFTMVLGIDIDAAGNLYLAEDTGTIRKVTPGGVVTTIAGSVWNSGLVNGVGTAARFDTPEDVAVDRLGYLYVSDSGNRVIRRIKLATGEVSTIAGSGTSGTTDGPGASARFGRARGLAADGGGNIYVIDTNNDQVRKVARDGYVTTVAGGTTGFMDGFRSSARFNAPGCLAVDAQGAIYVADIDNHALRRIK